MTRRSYSLNDALSDPRGAFRSPENLVSDPRLDRTAKLKILRKWRDDAYAHTAAEYEGMQGGMTPMLHRVCKAINQLTRDNK